jgi:hypothetical protein
MEISVEKWYLACLRNVLCPRAKDKSMGISILAALNQTKAIFTTFTKMVRENAHARKPGKSKYCKFYMVHQPFK